MKIFKNLFKQENLTLTLQNVYQERSSLSIKESSKILTQKSNQHTFRTRTWKIYDFKCC